MRRAGTLLALAAATLVVAAPASAATEGLSQPGVQSHAAFVDRAVVARSAPSERARRVGRLTTRTQDGTDEVVGVLARSVVAGQEWLRVQLPVKPAGATGWIPRSAVGELRTVDTWLRVSTSTLRATLVRRGKVVFSAPVGVGRRRWPTPKGTFYVRDRLVPKQGGGPYGPLAFGTSARSRVLTDWPGGAFIGIHGTNQPGLLPGRVSHGCIRLRNADILRLDALMPVGTPVTVS